MTKRSFTRGCKSRVSDSHFRATALLTFSPRSSSVRSSTLPAMTSHRQSTSASRPRKIGEAAESASCSGLRVSRRFADEMCNTHHDRSYWHECIIHPPCLRHAASLERDLQAAAAHPKAHRVHVDVIWQRCTVSGVYVMILVSSQAPAPMTGHALESSGHFCRS